MLGALTELNAYMFKVLGRTIHRMQVIEWIQNTMRFCATILTVISPNSPFCLDVRWYNVIGNANTNVYFFKTVFALPSLVVQLDGRWNLIEILDYS